MVGNVYLRTATSPKDNGRIVFGNHDLPHGGRAGKIKPEQAEQMRQADGTAGIPRGRRNVTAGVETTRNIVLLSGEIQHQLGVAGFRGDGSIRIHRHVRAYGRSLSAEYGLFGIGRNLVGRSGKRMPGRTGHLGSGTHPKLVSGLPQNGSCGAGQRTEGRFGLDHLCGDGNRCVIGGRTRFRLILFIRAAQDECKHQSC